MTDERRQTTQTIAWFWDLYKRELVDLDPPYQRRSVWSPAYKDYFIDTILLNYPAPALFVFEEIDENGVTNYSVVDGKQRLSTVFEFLSNLFPVGDKASMTRLRGLYFQDLEPEIKRKFFGYQFSIEFLPSTDEGTLNNIFDRINRNVAKLTPQELRHAKYSGLFATKADELAELLESLLPKDFPRILSNSRKQMKDVELVAQLLLLTEKGIESYSQNDLDVAYSDRDDEWEQGVEIEKEFRKLLSIISSLAEDILSGEARRLRNQADFYALYGALLNLSRNESGIDSSELVARLNRFMEVVNAEDKRQTDPEAKSYYEAARSASNDAAQRRERIRILTNVMTGEYKGARA